MHVIIFWVGVVIFSFNATAITTGGLAAEDPPTNMVQSAVVTEKPMLDADTMALINSWPKGAATNGLFCAVQISRPLGNEPKPVCDINVVNTTTNFVRGILNLPRETLYQVDLFDVDGKAVEKTTAGKQFNLWTQKQMEDWFNEQVRIRWSGRAKTAFPADVNYFGNFGIPDIFQLNKPGEYTLHLKMQLVQPKLTPSQKIDRLQITWLPEVVAKVQIEAEDIRKAGVVTNAPAKTPR